MRAVQIPLCALLASLTVLPSHANPDITSREYKLLLDPGKFTYSSESSTVSSYYSAAQSQIQTAINRSVSGALAYDRTRLIRFYDSPGSCLLNSKGYIFRERVENGSSEVTLKYRGYDRYIADFENLSGSQPSAVTKLEEDVTSKTGQPFVVAISHATTEPNTRTLNDFQDVNVHFPGFAASYAIPNSTPLTLVSNFTATERQYSGPVIDLGEFDAELVLTLWYHGTPTSSSKPVVAEVSFKYADPAADYTKPVVNRAATAFAALNGMSSWVSTTAQTKTQYVYNLNPTFCQ